MKKGSSLLRNAKEQDHKNRRDTLLQLSDKYQKRAVERITNHKSSGWLTRMPTAHDEGHLSSAEFRDGLAVRYRLPLANSPLECDGLNCKGESFDPDHGLNCKGGGLVNRRHNNIREMLGSISAAAFGNQVTREPVLVEPNAE
eukprot:Selendium_serpulae@DN6356_c0_g1_i4.p1